MFTKLTSFRDPAVAAILDGAEFQCIALPRPRPAHLGECPSFNAYAECIHEAFKRLGVIKY